MKISILAPSIIAAIYCIAVMVVARGERLPSGGGNWITLRGIGTFIFTLPSSLLFEKFSRFNIDSNFHVAASMLLNAGLIFGIVYGVLKLFQVK